MYSEPGQRSKMEPFGKVILLLNYVLPKKNSILNLLEGSEHVSGFKYVRVLNISKCWQYDRVLNMRWDAIMEGF